MRQTLTIVLLTAFAAGPMAAQTPGVSFGAEPGTFTTGLDGTRGWQFSVIEAIYITALGVYDHGGDGLAEARQVGLWDAGSALLASLNMPAGVVGSLGADNFRYMMLETPLLLNPGIFRIGAFYLAGAADVVAQNAAPFGAPGFVVYEGARLLRDGFGDPTEISAVVGGAFGPNFLFESADAQVVPEPVTMILMGTGLAGIGVAGRRRRRALDA
jgi:hypothetical protein